MATVDVSAEGVEAPLAVLESDARRILAHLGMEDAELSILVVDDPRIRTLNRDWRDEDEPTDVLSFSQQEGEPMGQESLLGDIVVSVETAARQAAEHGWPLERELRLLLVHGICHLLGHDHAEPEEARSMAELESALTDMLTRSDPSLASRGLPG